ncbi:MAG: RNA-guided endonuclease TnpB family protein [Xenococcaceae cyanobacterium MO_207.B15]|nr:RNA-guided endonuclease TnpB family protein [Xenococcaceae cyanobacterium MO_207.B15]
MKVRIYPSKEQKQLLARQFGCSRFWWNRSLALQYEHRTNNGRWLKRTELNAMLPQLKKELPWLKTDCYSQVLQATSKHLEQALKNWFEGRAKKPRFKAKSNRQSISFPQNVKVVGSQIKVPKVGLIDAIITLEIEGTIKTVTLCVTPSGKYFASIGLDDSLPEKETSYDGKITGIDLGLKDYVTCHNGTNSYSVKHPKWLKGHERNLRKQQKQLSRRQKGSNRRNKARKLVASVHERLSNARQDFLHKLSRKIIDESQVVVVENLNIKGMVKNRKLSKAITQSGWGMFLNFLDYKLKHKGGVLVEIERFFPSSKLCSNCGHKYQDLQLCEREWTCSACNTKHSRDENAAKNIRVEGMRIIGLGHSPRGDDVRLETCFEQLSVKRVPTESLS